MNSTFRKLLLCAALSTSSTVSAMTYVMPDDRAMLQRADGVLVGTVVGSPVAGEKRGLPQLRYRVVIERVLAGRLARSDVMLELPGTLPDADLRVFVPGIPSLAAGQRVLVFFNRHRTDVIAPAELSLGLFFELNDAVGKQTYVRQLEGGHAINKTAAIARLKARDAARFEHWIRRTSAGAAVVTDYYVESATKFTLAPSGFPDGLSSRWFQFDANQSVSFRAVANGMVGAAFDEFSAVSTALTAWSNDAGSRILLAYGGTVASDLGDNSTDGINAVVWDDPGNDIAGSYNCSSGGVLAIGGTYASSNTGVVDGRVFHRAIEGFVITQDNAACAFNGRGGLDGAEILGHEIGHTLGFGHSCEGATCVAGSVVDDALMRSYVHRDGRGASLRIDDRAVAAIVYPAPSAGAPPSVFLSGFEGR